METLEDKLRRPASLGGYKGSMTTDDIRKAIRKSGKYKTKEGRISIYSVPCSVCGKEILSNDPEEMMLDVEASVTKRGNGCLLAYEVPQKILEYEDTLKEVTR